jgi:hypothetical protein
MYTFTACCGGPRYGIAARQETWNQVYNESPPVWKIEAFNI